MLEQFVSQFDLLTASDGFAT